MNTGNAATPDVEDMLQNIRAGRAGDKTDTDRDCGAGREPLELLAVLTWPAAS
jgi:hypothetical protein